MSRTGFVRDRDEAIFSFDRFKIETFCKKYDIDMPDSDWAFWLGICESILSVPSAPVEAKAKAAKWINDNYREGMYGGDR